MTLLLAILLSIIFGVATLGLVGSLVVNVVAFARKLRGKEKSDTLLGLYYIFDGLFRSGAVTGGFLALYLLVVVAWSQI